MDDNVHRILRQ